MEADERGGIKIHLRKQEGQLKKQGEKLMGESKDVVFHSTPFIGPSPGFHFKASSSKQLVLDLTRLDSLIGPLLGVNIADKAPSNPIVDSNHVPSALKDVGKLASTVALKDMVTSSTSPDLLLPQHPILNCQRSWFVMSLFWYRLVQTVLLLVVRKRP